jgi:hypothetical protein
VRSDVPIHPCPGQIFHASSFLAPYPFSARAAKAFLDAVDQYHEGLAVWLPTLVGSLPSEDAREKLIGAVQGERAKIAAAKLVGNEIIDPRAAKKAAKAAEKARLAAEEAEEAGGGASRKASKKASKKKGDEGEAAAAPAPAPAAAPAAATKTKKDKKAVAPASASDEGLLTKLVVEVSGLASASSTPLMPVASPTKLVPGGADPSALHI